MKDILLFFRLFFSNFYFSPFFHLFLFTIFCTKKIHLINFSFSASNSELFVLCVVCLCRLFGEKSGNVSKYFSLFSLSCTNEFTRDFAAKNFLQLSIHQTYERGKMMRWLVYLGEGKMKSRFLQTNFNFFFRFPLNHRFFRVITRKKRDDDDDFVDFKDSFGFFLSSL